MNWIANKEIQAKLLKKLLDIVNMNTIMVRTEFKILSFGFFVGNESSEKNNKYME
jgi:hypothetical protein